MIIRRRLSGIEEQQDIKIASTIATGAVSAAASGGLIAASVAGPVGLAIAGVALLAQYLFTTSKEGMQKIAATKIVDQAEMIFKKNIEAWNQEPHTAANQAAALQTFDFVWSQVKSGCSNGLEAAGDRCISERQRGGKYDYFVWYRDPIATAIPIDAPVLLAPLQTGSAAIGQATGLTSPQLLALAALVFVVVIL